MDMLLVLVLIVLVLAGAITFHGALGFLGAFVFVCAVFPLAFMAIFAVCAAIGAIFRR